jgi:hypothetical protein
MSSRLEQELAKRLGQFKGKVAKVGWFPSAQYPEDEGGLHVAEVAIIQELGAPAANIPARPFIMPTVNAQGDKWAENIGKGVKAVMRGATTMDNVLQIVGAQAAGDIRKTISEVRSPPLAEYTLAKRRADGYTDQPLHRTGYMIATCTNVVGEAEE